MQRKSLFYRFFVSYLGIGLTLIIFFGFVFYYFNVSSLDAEVRSNQFNGTSQSLNKMDYMLESMSNMAYHFSSTEFGEQSQEAWMQPGGDSFLIQQLESYEQNLPVPATVGLYRRGDTGIYLSTGREAYQALENTLGKHADFTMSSLFGTLNSVNRATAVRIVGREDRLPYDAPSTAVIYPIPYMSSIPSMSLVFFVSGEELNTVVENYSGEQARNVYLLDDTLQVVYQSEQYPLTEAEILALIRMKGTGVFETTLHGEQMVVMRALSDNTGYSMLVLMRADVFFSRVGLMRSVIMMCVGMFVVLTLIMAFVMAVRNYRPIGVLMRLTTDDDPDDAYGDADEEGSNELEVLQQRITQTRSRNRELGMLLDMQRPYILHTCISNLLRGKVDDRQALEFQMQCANVSFSRPFLQVLLITPEGKDELGDRIQTIITVCGRLALQHATLYSAEIILEKRVAVIVNSAEAQVDGRSVGVIVAGLLSEALKPYGCGISVGVGSTCTDIEGIHTSLVEAQVVVNEYLPSTSETILCFDDIPEQSSVDYAVSFTDQSMLTHALKQGDRVVALQSLENMLGRIAKGAGSFLIVQYQCFDIANTLIKVVRQMDGDVSKIDLHALGSFKNIAEFGAQARALVEGICAQYDAMKEQKSSQLSANLIRYVTQNYQNADLSLEQMASHFELSPSYLSRFFKQATGRTFIQYVTLLRMDFVKDRLLNTDDQIKDIVCQAGYIDTPSFVRKFKAMEGVTPGQYRQQVRQAQTTQAL